MKKQLNEIKRLQKIAGLLKENENNSIDPATLSDIDSAIKMSYPSAREANPAEIEDVSVYLGNDYIKLYKVDSSDDQDEEDYDEYDNTHVAFINVTMEDGNIVYYEVREDNEYPGDYEQGEGNYGEPNGVWDPQAKKFAFDGYSSDEEDDYELEENDNSQGIESQLMSTIKGQSNDMSFLSGVSDQEFVAALKKLKVNYKISDSGMSTDYYIGKPGSGIVFSNNDGDWMADDYQLAEISESEISIGDDGYGGKNITISQKNDGIEIIKRDANDMNRVSGNIFLPLDPESIDELIAFLTKVKSNPGKKKQAKKMSDDERKEMVRQQLKRDLGRDF